MKKVIIAVMTFVGVVALGNYISMLGWNWLAPMFNLPTFNFWQMFVFTFIIKWLISMVKPSKEGK